MIPRLIESQIIKALDKPNKVILILGARQVGKTTLAQKLQKQLENDNKKILYLNCDTEEDRKIVDTTSRTKLGQLVQDIDYLFIDEAQRLENPGLTVKLLHDLFTQTKIVVTGSSSFELKNSLSDVLTGRYLDFTLYPLSLTELLSEAGEEKPVQQKARAESLLDSALLYGLYPEIYQTKKARDRKALLDKIIESYLFKDILSFQRVRQPRVIQDLTRALAYQVGSEVSENELANRLKIDRKTVISYLDILEQSFVIFRLFPYSKNPRREIGKNFKVYFTDIGIRNALIGDFNPINLRADQGQLWENFLVIERQKHHANQGVSIESHFWRAYSGAEVDYLERIFDQTDFRAYEIKYVADRLSKGVGAFEADYGIKVKLINKDNFLDFIA